MHLSPQLTLKGSLASFFGILALSTVVNAANDPLAVVDTDVVILGGGASGTYAAIRLREDYGKKVLLVEKEDVLGGHTNTYTIPKTGEAFNYGVQSYVDYQGAKAFFKRFGIPLQGNVLFSSDTVNVDPNTGKPVQIAGDPPFNLTLAALQKFYEIIKPWDDIQLPGYWNFPTSAAQIPADLLLPFKDFVAKYKLEAMQPIIFVVSGQEVTSTDLTLFVVKNFGSTILEGFLNNTFFDPVPFNNSLLYSAAGKVLGKDVMLSSSVVEASRTEHGVKIMLKDSRTGAKTQVSAKKLLVASQPSIDNLAVFGLDEQEKSVFNTWSYVTVYTATLKTNLVPDNTSIAFSTPANSTSPAKPYSFGVTWNGVPGYFWIIFGSSKSFTPEEASAAIVSQMNTLSKSGAFPAIGSKTPSSEVVAISSHSQVTWGQTAKQIQAGFVKDLYALQGHKSTWYTGGLWCPDYSSHVWAFTDTVLPKLLKEII